jgi:hypothetical protein
MLSKKLRKNFLIYIRFTCNKIFVFNIYLVDNGNIYNNMILSYYFSDLPWHGSLSWCSRRNFRQHRKPGLCLRSSLIFLYIYICLYVECSACLVQFALIRGLFRSTMQSIMSREGQLHFKVLRNSRRILENGCALPSSSC